MKIAVVGGTGFVGGEIVRQLVSSRIALEQGIKIVVVSRHAPDPFPFAGRAEFRSGDVTRPETLAPALDGVDCVIQALQFPNAPVENPSRGWTYGKVDGEGTEHLAVAARAAGVRRYLYVSGAGAGENRKESWFRAKDRAESAVKSNFPMDHTILRPNWIYGPGDRSMSKFVFFAKALPLFPLIGDGRNRIQPLFVEDAARAVLTALHSDVARGKTYGLGGPETLTMRQVAEVIFRVVGERPLLGAIAHPIPFMKLAGFFAEFLPTPPISRGMIDFVTGESLVSSDAARADLAFSPLSLEAGLRRYL